MHIKEVLEIAVVGIFSDKKLAEQLFLKGGAALHFLEHIDERLSTDIDMSSPKAISNEESFFGLIEKALETAYSPYKYDVIDFKFSVRPKKKETKPDWWRGWLCQFKLGEHKHTKLSLEQQRRFALVPEGATSSNIDIEISESEYCGKGQHKKIKGIVVSGYTRTLLAVEKIRALCQQHPDYPHIAKGKNRTRDLVDIYNLSNGHLNDSFFSNCKMELPKSFAAKEVSLDLLKAFWDNDFIEVLKKGFPQVADTIKGTQYPFETYIENTRYILDKIGYGANTK